METCEPIMLCYLPASTQMTSLDSNSDESVNHDQIANKTIFASPSSPSLCNAYLPNHIIWSSQGYTDVIEPGFVIVEQLN